MTLNQQQANHYVEVGARFVGIGVDTLLLANGAKSLINAFRDGEALESAKGSSGY